MHTWAKRGLQTALVTGGLLMLGTGIASAEENVDPDRPASPLDASISMPTHIANNVVGTPLGQKNVPTIDRDLTVGTDDVTGALPKQARGVQQAATPVTKGVTDQVAPVVNKASTALGGHDVFRGNRVNADVVVPVDISGNAIALGGNATTTNDSTQAVDRDRPVATDGAHTVLGGNVVDADWAAPVQVTGNAVSAVGVSNTVNNSSQSASSTGDIQSSGTHGVISGNLVAPQFATPVQVTGNAITGAGKANATNQADTSATSGGTLQTDGKHALLSGNAAGGPLATPIEVNGNPVAGLGHSSTLSSSSADATAGDAQEGPHHEMAYLLSNGDPAVGSGNAVQASHAGPVAVNCNAAAGAGVADCTGDATTTNTAGGATETTGHGSIGSGTVGAAPTGTPIEVFGNAAAAGGKAATANDNSVTTNAGGSNYTNGTGGIASASLVSPSLCGPVDGFGNVVGGAGSAHTTATNTAACTAGGDHDGTTGDSSVGSGNAATAPVVLPTEGFGNGVAGLGTADTTATEDKGVGSGGGGNTDDDAGTLASNLVSAPVAGAAQAFGNGAGVLGRTNAHGDTSTVATAGGDMDKAKGTGGELAGNLAQAPLTIPVQAFGNGATAGGAGHSTAANDSSFTAGGDALANGMHGIGAGNIVSTPTASATQLTGAAAGAIGRHSSDADSTTATNAGGNANSTGEFGFGAGNVVSPQALPLAEVFGDAAAATGHGTSTTGSDITAGSGGDIATNGDHGFLSGNLAQVPAAAVPQPFGDAAGALGGVADTTTTGTTNGVTGGTTDTSGRFGSLSGLNLKPPVGADAPIYDVPVEVLGKAFTDSTNSGDIVVGDRDPQLFVPVDGSGLGATQLPRIPQFPFTPMRSSLPAPAIVPGLNAPEGLPFAGDLAGNLVQVPSVPSVGTLPIAALPGVGSGQLPTASVPGLPGADALSGIAPGEPAGMPFVGNLVPALPGLGNAELPTGQLPAVPALPGVAQPELPTAMLPVIGQGLPGLPGADRSDAPTAELPVIGDAVPALPALGDGVPALPMIGSGVPAVPAVPTLPALGDGVPALPGLGDAELPTGQLPAVPALPGVAQPELPTAVLPVIGSGVPALPGLADAGLPTDVLPVIGSGVPALPGLGDAGLPTAQLPVVGAKPAMPLPTPVPAMPALPALGTDSVLPTDFGSLADTAAKLQALFGQLPSATSLPMV